MIKQKDIRISKNNREIYGTLTEPNNMKSCPAVIFSHGYNVSGKDFEKMAV